MVNLTLLEPHLNPKQFLPFNLFEVSYVFWVTYETSDELASLAVATRAGFSARLHFIIEGK